MHGWKRLFEDSSSEAEVRGLWKIETFASSSWSYPNVRLQRWTERGSESTDGVIRVTKGAYRVVLASQSAVQINEKAQRGRTSAAGEGHGTPWFRNKSICWLSMPIPPSSPSLALKLSGGIAVSIYHGSGVDVTPLACGVLQGPVRLRGLSDMRSGGLLSAHLGMTSQR